MILRLGLEPIRTIGREELQKKLDDGLPLQGAFAADAR